MSWSVSLGRVFGSDIRIHLTFLLLLAWIGFAHWQQGGSAAAIDGVLFVIAIFACVTLHELGHAYAARRYGIATPDITLLPIGGVARLERMPEDPKQEIVIAIAGPLVNVVIAAVLILILGARPDLNSVVALQDTGPSFAARVAAVNVILVLFNLIPAFPMDGGRVLRAVLAMRMSRMKATAVAARIGQAIAFAFGFLGLTGGNPMLVLVAVFVYMAAAAESEGTSLLDAARRMRARDAMISAYEALDTTASLDDAAKALLRTTQHEFPVVDGGGKLRGMLSRQMLVATLAARGENTPVIEAMETGIPEIPADTRLDKVLEAMQTAGRGTAALTGPDGRFAGYISRENLAELTMLTAADWHAPARRQG
ncbi:MAG: site-2 protease family protein [Rhodobiaceae bacterium]|nr:site-2 protease family protein [Rhodobiaceae bacterium]MCC0012511.1 site-2 protease family protein [Rhodobiaceae bacterium]MCC0061718.1 site-2 protease family protein [Rhodobiaceae bacterium]